MLKHTNNNYDDDDDDNKNNDNNNDNDDGCIERPKSKFFAISSLRRELSPTYAQEARAQSCAKSRATHGAFITCNMSCATRCEGTAKPLSLTEFKSHLFQPYFLLAETTNRQVQIMYIYTKMVEPKIDKCFLTACLRPRVFICRGQLLSGQIPTRAPGN